LLKKESANQTVWWFFLVPWSIWSFNLIFVSFKFVIILFLFCITSLFSSLSESLKVSELLDAVIANVRHDEMSITGDGQAGRSLQLATVRVDHGVQVTAGQPEHLQWRKNHFKQKSYRIWGDTVGSRQPPTGSDRRSNRVTVKKWLIIRAKRTVIEAFGHFDSISAGHFGRITSRLEIGKGG